MADGITDTTNAIVPLIGLGIVAGMAGRMIEGPRRTRTRTVTRTVYRKAPVKGVTVVKHHHHKHRSTSFFD
jgi:hypothetical protein